MTRSFLVILVCLGFASCQAATPLAGSGAVPVLQRLPGEFAGPMVDSGLRTPIELAVTDAAKWQEIWTQLVSRRRPVPALPNVDFDRSTVVVVSIGQQRSGGHAVHIDGVERLGERWRVRYTVVAPGTGCITTSAIQAPADVALLSGASLIIDFEATQLRQDCESPR